MNIDAFEIYNYGFLVIIIVFFIYLAIESYKDL